MNPAPPDPHDPIPHGHMIGRVYRDEDGRKVRVYGLGSRMVAYVIVVGDKTRTTRTIPVDWLLEGMPWTR